MLTSVMVKPVHIRLKGCTPEPLVSYLKALGVLSALNGTNADIRGSWVDGNLVLTSPLGQEEICSYFLQDYSPAPIVSPWNGGSGFYAKDNQTAIQAIRASGAVRLQPYRNCLHAVDRVFHSVGLAREKRPEKEAKTNFLVRLRSQLPDEALAWLDASVVLSGDSPKFPPMLGTGGNDGRFDITNNFMQCLTQLFDVDSGTPNLKASEWLRHALFQTPAPGLIQQAIGQYSPGQVGGPNSTNGFDSKGSINPWDFVLMIEGALTFAAAAVRRGEQTEGGLASFPFTVSAIAAGSGTLGAGDATSRGELWMPLWSKPSNYEEVRVLLAEGRVALGEQPARNALDFVRAVHSLGGYRGIASYQRFSLLERSGMSYLATPLEHVRVSVNQSSHWIADLERNYWLRRLRKFTSNSDNARRFAVLNHRLENRLFMLAQRRPSPVDIQSLIALLGDIQQALSRSAKAQEDVPPVPQLPKRWLRAADDGSEAYRIAYALCSLQGIDKQPMPLRSQLYPIHHMNRNVWLDNARDIKSVESDPAIRAKLQLDSLKDLESLMIALLQTRLSIASRLGFADKPLMGYAGIDLDDLTYFLANDRTDSRIRELVFGFSLCQVTQSTEKRAGDGEVNAFFALCKLAITPNRMLRNLDLLRDDERLSQPNELISKLAVATSGQSKSAIELAWRRLRNSGITPIMPLRQLPELSGISTRRLAAALLIPLTFGAHSALANAVLSTGSERVDDAA